MIVHCHACGKAVSNRLELCPFCRYDLLLTVKKDDIAEPLPLEELIPAFNRRSLA